LRVIQADPFGDGWWVLVEDDNGEKHLTHEYDEMGRDAEYPGDEVFFAKVEAINTELVAREQRVCAIAEDGTKIGPGTPSIDLSLTQNQIDTWNNRFDQIETEMRRWFRVYQEMGPKQRKLWRQHNPMARRFYEIASLFVQNLEESD